MYVVMGATGHVGSAVATALLDRGKAVTVVVRDEGKGAAWQERGAGVAVADVRDVDALRRAFGRGLRAYLLNPPGNVAGDADREERETAAAAVAALAGSGLESIVAASTYGAQPGERIGDLGTLFEFEEWLRAQPIRATIVRGAYYFTDWDAMLEPARKSTLPSFFPTDLTIPMVAPADLGRIGADLLRPETQTATIVCAEGPQRYTVADVAAAFARALGRTVEPAVIPLEQWQETLPAARFLRCVGGRLRADDGGKPRRVRVGRTSAARDGDAGGACCPAGRRY